MALVGCHCSDCFSTTSFIVSTACTIATYVVHSKLCCCNSFFFQKSQLSRLQQIQNSLARTVMKAPKSCHITPILRSLHWLRITERIVYKLLSLTYKVLTILNLHTFISSSPLNVLAVLALHPSLLLLGHLHHPLKIIDCSFRYASPRLWNQLPATLRQPYSGTSSSISDSPITSSSFDLPLCTSITFFLFYS